ncbi:hypothetical protein [Gaoshiqia sp. Z1-71]|uniref:hypothetical protein n=1 Tax=Gaoshiqia hydrogeniformans TaxID=3290090 RepID=UPI003BF7C82F
MKLKFKHLLLAFLMVPFTVQAAQYSKTVRQGYAKSLVTALNITNKFGTIEINDRGGDSVTVSATIRVESISEGKASQLMDLIRIDIRRNGGLLEVKTIISDNFKTKENFSIDYAINIPKDRNLTVDNKFGNVVVKELEAKGQFAVGYGNLSAGVLNAPSGSDISLDLSYGKADIEYVTQLSGDIKYSKLFIGGANRMKLISKYSGLNIDEIKELQLDSKYDGVSISEITSLSALSKYTNYKIEELKKELKINTEYGSIRVNEVSADFSRIEISNSYGGIVIGLNQASYQLDAQCDYCDVNYPTDRFRGDRIKNNTKLEIRGAVGEQTGNKNVIIKSRYGNIKLNN